ncbi:MAG: glycosyltransferase [Dehalococcoidales bacterium]|nr:glycosyltransferase [Dehalococcoidales bacterium]
MEAIHFDSFKNLQETAKPRFNSADGKLPDNRREMNRQAFLIIAPGNKARADEAWSKEIKDISDILSSTVLTCGDVTGFLKKNGHYLVLKNHFALYPLFGLLSFILALRSDRVLLECSPNSVYFSVLARLIRKSKIIYRIRSHSWIDPHKKASRRLYRLMEHFERTVVTTESSYKSLIMNIPADKISIMTPGILIERYPPLPPPPMSDCFHILFASAPLSNHRYPEIFETKGINILLKSIKYLNENLDYNIKLHILWRNTYLTELNGKVTQMGLEDKVIIVNEKVNVIDYYDKCHATVFPAGDVEHSPDFPSSIMESISTGRPVIVSNVLQISEIIRQYKSGVVCAPNETDLSKAIQSLITNYKHYVKNCVRTARLTFSLKENVKPLMDGTC